MVKQLPLWWRGLHSDWAFAALLAAFLGFLFTWPSLHWGSSAFERLPWWGPVAPVAIWLLAMWALWRKRRRDRGRGPTP